jgi:hypothetical protein
MLGQRLGTKDHLLFQDLTVGRKIKALPVQEEQLLFSLHNCEGMSPLREATDMPKIQMSGFLLTIR